MGGESWLLCFYVLLVSRDGYVALSNYATDLSAVCDCSIFLFILTYYFRSIFKYTGFFSPGKSKIELIRICITMI